MTTQQELVKEFMSYLDIEEESDSGRIFRPVRLISDDKRVSTLVGRYIIAIIESDGDNSADISDLFALLDNGSAWVSCCRALLTPKVGACLCALRETIKEQQ